MQKKILKILSVLIIIVGFFEVLGAILIGGYGAVVFSQKAFFEQTDFYVEITSRMKEYPLLTALDMDALSLSTALLFLFVAYIAVKAVCNFIYGISGLKAAKGIKIRRSRIIGTAALVIGICNMIDDIFVTSAGISIDRILFIAASVLFLYCLNGISPKRGDRYEN